MNATTQRDTHVDANARISRLEKSAILSALWMFVLLNLIFRDLHEIVKAEFLEDALNGTYNGVEVTEALFLLGGVLIEIPIMMMLMSWVLPQRANRWANVLAASLFGLLVILGAPGDLDDFFHAGLELVALGAIVWQVARWKQSPSRTDPT